MSVRLISSRACASGGKAAGRHGVETREHVAVVGVEQVTGLPGFTPENAHALTLGTYCPAMVSGSPSIAMPCAGVSLSALAALSNGCGVVLRAAAIFASESALDRCGSPTNRSAGSGAGCA